MNANLKQRVKRRVPKSLLLFSRLFRAGDGKAVLFFLARKDLGLSLAQRLGLVFRFYRVSRSVDCAHAEHEMLSVAGAILAAGAETRGCVVEAGCFKGGSSAKLSIGAKLAGRDLAVFDSFEGIPQNDENHGLNIYGGNVAFRKGDYCGTLDEVAQNIRAHGEIGVCRFFKGFFESTMPNFHEPVAVAYVDVDLASSTRTCLQFLWPLLSPGGVIFSQDGHLPLVLEVLRDKEFWERELGCAPPEISGMGRRQLIWFSKPAVAETAWQPDLALKHHAE